MTDRDVRQSVAYWVAFGFMLSACLLTIHSIRQHLHWNTKPRLRKHIIRILCMVPIYAFTSWLGLTYPGIAIYFDLGRECYEAFVIYSFYQLLVQYLGGEDRLSYRLAGKENQKHQFPLCCLPSWQMVDYDGMSTSERERVEAIVAERARDDAINHESKEQSIVNGEVVNVMNVDVIEAGENDDEITIEHPSDVQIEDVTSIRSSRFNMFRNMFHSNPENSPLTPRTPQLYMATGLAHDHVMNPFRSHSRQQHSNPSSPIMTSSASAVSSSQSHAILPYVHSPFLFHTQLGTLQYCILKPILALIAFVLGLTNVYGPGEFNPKVGYPYIAFITNASQIWAMYCLILFYLALKEDLAPIKPVPKFITVKAVVFFTWWQSVLFAVLEFEGVIHSTDDYTALQWETALQDFVVCLEMLAAAVAHVFFFSYKDFFDADAPLIIAPVFQSIKEVVNVSDVYVNDLRHIHKRHKSRTKRKDRHKNRSGENGPSQMLAQNLLDDEHKQARSQMNDEDVTEHYLQIEQFPAAIVHPDEDMDDSKHILS